MTASSRFECCCPYCGETVVIDNGAIAPYRNPEGKIIRFTQESPAQSEPVAITDGARSEFRKYFAQNYPAGALEIADPNWHADHILRAAAYSLRTHPPAQSAASSQRALVEAIPTEFWLEAWTKMRTSNLSNLPRKQDAYVAECFENIARQFYTAALDAAGRGS